MEKGKAFALTMRLMNLPYMLHMNTKELNSQMSSLPPPPNTAEWNEVDYPSSFSWHEEHVLRATQSHLLSYRHSECAKKIICVKYACPSRKDLIRSLQSSTLKFLYVAGLLKTEARATGH